MKTLKSLIALLFASILGVSTSQAQLVDPVPFTFTNGQVIDATQVMANYNAIVNDVNANAAANGANSDITALIGLSTPISYLSGGTSVYIGGTVTGTANAVVIASPTPTGFTLTSGKRVIWIVATTNTAAATLNVSGTGALAVLKLTPGGATALTGGEMVAGAIAEAVYDGTQYQLVTNNLSVLGALTTIASATTTDLGTITTHNVSITGTTTITSFGSSASTVYPFYYLTFTGALTLTHNGTSLILPGATSITTAAGDYAAAMYLGSGNWKVLSYVPVSGIPLRLTSGTPAQGDILYFDSTSQTPTRLAAGTSGQFLKTQGAGANPLWATASTGDYQAFTTTGAGSCPGANCWTKPAAVTAASQTYVQCWGAGGGGGSNSSSGGGGGGAYVDGWFLTSALGATETVTIPAGGAINTAGGNASFGSRLTAYGGGNGISSANSGGGGGGGNTSAGSPGLAGPGDGGAGGGTSYGTITTSASGAGSYGAGGGNVSGVAGGNAVWGGAGGGGSGTNGGNALYGGAGGAGSGGGSIGGTSQWGGNGGASGIAGSAPGGGGGRNAAGGRGECRIWTSG